MKLNEEYKTFLEQQLERTKEQASVLDDMDIVLHEMKKIAEYAAVMEETPQAVRNNNDSTLHHLQ